MVKFTVSEAKLKLGRLLDQASKGEEVFLRRKNRLYRIEEVREVQPIPKRPSDFFAADQNDPMITLANEAPDSFTPES